MCTFIGFVLHTFGIQHRQCDIISGVYHNLFSSVRSVVNNSDVMSLSDWLLLLHLSVWTTAMWSLWVSWCPVHISAAAVSPSCGNTYCVELEPCDHASALQLHSLNSTGFPAVTARIQCKLCLLLHNSLVSHSLQYLSQLLMPVSDIPSRLAFRSARNSDIDVLWSRRKVGKLAFCIAALAEYSVHSWLYAKFLMYNKMSFINETDYAELIGLRGICRVSRNTAPRAPRTPRWNIVKTSWRWCLGLNWISRKISRKRWISEGGEMTKGWSVHLDAVHVYWQRGVRGACGAVFRDIGICSIMWKVSNYAQIMLVHDRIIPQSRRENHFCRVAGYTVWSHWQVISRPH